MDFQKKDWQFRDLIAEYELNRMEDGIEEGITKAEQAKETADEAKQTADAAADAAANAQSDIDAHLADTAPHSAYVVQKSGDTMTGDLTLKGTAPIFIDMSDLASSWQRSLRYLMDGNIVAGIGLYGNQNNVNRLYMGFGPTPHNGEGLWVKPGGPSFYDGSTERTIWHAGNLPYEEGVWTPELRFGGASDGIVYTTRLGIFTRIGRLVDIKASIILSNKGTSTGVAEIHGLPYANMAFGPVLFEAFFRNIDLTGTITLIPTLAGGQNYLVLTAVRNNDNNVNLTDAQFNDTSVIAISGTYFI